MGADIRYKVRALVLEERVYEVYAVVSSEAEDVARREHPEIAKIISAYPANDVED